MFQALLGQENVDTVTNEVVHKSVSYWAAGSILKVIEEVQAADGTGGYDLLNKLKEPITNDRLMVEHTRKVHAGLPSTSNSLARERFARRSRGQIRTIDLSRAGLVSQLTTLTDAGAAP